MGEKYMDYTVEGVTLETDQLGMSCRKDCGTQQLIKDNAMDHSKWRKFNEIY